MPPFAAVALRVVAVFGAGVLSCAAPCVWPLVPAYVGALGLDADRRGRAIAASLGFVASLAATFALFGAAAAQGAIRSGAPQRTVEILAGMAMVVFGIVALDGLRSRPRQASCHRSAPSPKPRWRDGTWQPLLEPARRSRIGRATKDRPSPATLPVVLRAAVIGVGFGAGWSPCVGPLLAGVLATAATGGGWLPGALLLAVFGIGLGVPFVVAGLLTAQLEARRARPVQRSTPRRPGAPRRRPARTGRWSMAAEGLGGVLLVVLGVLVAGGGASAIGLPVATVARGVSR